MLFPCPDIVEKEKKKKSLPKGQWCTWFFFFFVAFTCASVSRPFVKLLRYNHLRLWCIAKGWCNLPLPDHSDQDHHILFHFLVYLFPSPPPQHIFCENCVLQWLDRQNSCPLCRATVANYDPKWRDGSTAKWPQIFWLNSCLSFSHQQSLKSDQKLYNIILSPLFLSVFSFLSLSLSSFLCYFMPLFVSQCSLT